MMKDLTAEDILAAKDGKVESVDVPEWGGRVHIKVITGTERDAYEGSMIKMVGKKAVPNIVNTRAKLCSLGICDEKGNRLFDSSHITDLGNKSGAALDRVYDALMKLNKMDEGAVEAAVKNSMSSQSDDSGSG